MPHRHDHRARRDPQPARPAQQEAYGAPQRQQGGWPTEPERRAQPDDYYDGRQRGGVSEGSFARGGYGQGYPREYGGYGYEPRRSPLVRGEYAYPDVQAGPTARGAGHPHPGHDDAHYRQWRAEHLQSLDDDYRSYREQRRRGFPDEFSAWRDSRHGAAGEGEGEGPDRTQSSSAGDTASGDPSGSAAGLGRIHGASPRGGVDETGVSDT